VSAERCASSRGAMTTTLRMAVLATSLAWGRLFRLKAGLQRLLRSDGRGAGVETGARKGWRVPSLGFELVAFAKRRASSRGAMTTTLRMADLATSLAWGRLFRLKAGLQRLLRSDGRGAGVETGARKGWRVPSLGFELVAFAKRRASSRGAMTTTLGWSLCDA